MITTESPFEPNWNQIKPKQTKIIAKIMALMMAQDPFAQKGFQKKFEDPEKCLVLRPLKLAVKGS